jgi:serine/threonine protein kinase
LFIDNDGHIVLGDFGIARKLRPGENTIPRDDVFGTPAYTAPEMFTGEPYGREVDLWAFGVMLYELITGNVSLAPFAIPELVADSRFRKHSNQPVYVKMIWLGSPIWPEIFCTTNHQIAHCSRQPPVISFEKLV